MREGDDVTIDGSVRKVGASAEDPLPSGGRLDIFETPKT